MKITITLTNKELISYINAVKPFALFDDDSAEAANKFVKSCYEIKSYSSTNKGGTLEYTCDDKGFNAAIDISEAPVMRILGIAGRYSQQIVSCVKGLILTGKTLFSNYVAEVKELTDEYFNSEDDSTTINGMPASDYYEAKYGLKKEDKKAEADETAKDE